MKIRIEPPRMPATPAIFGFFIVGSFSPFARDTENASIASPVPSKMLFKKNEKSRFNFNVLRVLH